MKTIFVFSLVLFFCNPTHAQSSLQDFVLSKPMSDYYRLINKAEKLLITNEVKESSKYYDSAFVINSKPFAKDLLNAFYAEAQQDKFTKAFTLYKRLLNLGIKEEFVHSDNKTKLFFQKYKLQLSVYRPKNNFNYPLITELKKLDDIDTYHRRLANKDYSKYYQNIKTDDSITGIKLKQLILKYGFPNDYNLGIETDEIFKHNFYYIIWHQATSRETDFTNILLNAINNGKIEAHIAGFLIDKYNTEEVFSNTEISRLTLEKENIDSCCFVRDFSKDNNYQSTRLPKINQHRKKIGLETLEENQEKILYKYNGSPFLFPQFGYCGVNQYHLSNMEDLKSFLDRKIRVPLKYKSNVL